jgi:RNA polymerase sigma factor (sigma-70 family)
MRPQRHLRTYPRTSHRSDPDPAHIRGGTGVWYAVSTVSTTPLPPFQLVFDEHAGAVLAFLFGAIGAADAEDCFQETMLSALRAYPRLADASNLRGWLFTIARRKAIDARRAMARRPVPVADPDPGTAPDPTTEIDETLWDDVRRLPVKQQRAVVLRFAGDQSYPEIASAMSTTQDSARQSVHEGLKKLRRDRR